MRTRLLMSIFFVVTIFSLFSSCRKTEEEIIDCFGETILTSIHTETSGPDPKTIEFKVNYSGQMQITSVVWNFGDGVSISSKSNTISHTYNSAGTYTVKADINLDNGKCTISPTKSVTIQ